MDMDIITVDRNEARKAFLAYREEVRRAQEQQYDEAYQLRLEKMSQADRDARAQRERDDEALMRAYRQASLGANIISLTQTIIAGGLGANRQPKLAVARADQTLVHLTWSGAQAIYSPESGWRANNAAASKRFTVRGPATWARERTEQEWTGLIADVPAVPAHLRPGHDLSNYATLFEATWRRPATVRRVGDPALLKPLGGDLYAVLAVWDLTPLERAVLGIAPA